MDLEKKMEIVRAFAKQMEYTTREYNYTHYLNGRPCVCIELNETSDSEGESYSWCWYTDTGEEIW